MKKIAILTFVTTLCLALTGGLAGAVVQGPCADCHTMHNSQNGAVVVAGGPYQTLLKGDCIGCHGTTLGDNLLGTANTIPAVMHSAAEDLAGGNFGYLTGTKAVDATDATAFANPDTVGHNVMDLGSTYAESTAAMFPPPGDEYAQTMTASTFTCAGTLGCHGDRTIAGSMAAISGSHHAIDTMMKFGTINETLQGTATYSSYRFLKGVHGGEHALWNSGATVNSHNEYKGATAGVEAASASIPGGGTISGLCAECHGNFHGDATDIGTGPWLRHPTDIVLPSTATKEYQYYNGGAGTNNPYSLDAPVGRATIPTAAASAVVNPGTDDSIVTCLSCHKAHASANADILRWNYEDINAGGGASNTRCFICHTTKDGV